MGIRLLKCLRKEFFFRISLFFMHVSFSISKYTALTGTYNSLANCKNGCLFSLIGFVLSMQTDLPCTRDSLVISRHFAGVFRVSLFTRTQLEKYVYQIVDFPLPGEPINITTSCLTQASKFLSPRFPNLIKFKGSVYIGT